jgi:Transmembrane family 220, helix
MSRIADWTMTVLFVFAAAVQLNDPDPVPWVAVYGGAAAATAARAWRGRVPRVLPLGLAGGTLAWALAIAMRGPAAAAYFRMFDEWEMQSLPIEQAREATGLLVVAAWMIVLAYRGTRPRDSGSGLSGGGAARP